jgi:hypothetical protein
VLNDVRFTPDEPTSERKHQSEKRQGTCCANHDRLCLRDILRNAIESDGATQKMNVKAPM